MKRFLSNLNKLQDLIDIEIIKYKEKFKKNNSLFIKNWPNRYSYYSWSNRLSKEGALKSGYKKKDAYHYLWILVNAKDAIAELIWYLLTGALAISTTFNALLDIDCDIPTAQRKAAAAKFEAEVAKKDAAKPKEKYFTVHD